MASKTMKKYIDVFVIITFICSAIAGAAALPLQYYFYGMESPNFWWFIKVPFFAFTFGVIAAGSLQILLVILDGVLELLDPDEYWPHV